jgi:hypothetical protein
LKKGSILYSLYPGQGAFYTIKSALRRTGYSAAALSAGLQIARHEYKPLRTRIAAYEVLEDTPAAFGLAMANTTNGFGWLPQVVVPSYMTTLRFVNDFPLNP